MTLMKTHNFGENKTENINGTDVPVWQTPKYAISRDKAIEMIDSGKYGLADGDFWILMNANKRKTRMLYTGLILSHNGCLKINDKLDSKDKFYAKNLTKTILENGSLIYEYNDGELYEVGEVSKENCKNAYPFAMAFKRCFDRVVLKKSKLAFYGVYSEVEADEFKGDEPRYEFKNQEVELGQWKRWFDDWIFKNPDRKDGFLKAYKIKTTDELDKVLSIEQIDELMTKLKGENK